MGRGMMGPFVLAVLFAVLPQLSVAAEWDIANSGQPTHEARFTLDEGSWMSVDVSPDGKMLVFDLLGDIYRMKAEGGEATLLHGGPAIERMPRFSPDGSLILYISDRSGSDNLWTSRLDGSEAKAVTHEMAAALSNPAWAADGNSVAASKRYATIETLDSSEIRLFNRAGGAGRVLVDAPANGENVDEVAFSPDGRYAYYTERVTPAHVSHVYVDALHANFAVMRRDLETGAVEELIRGFGGAMAAEVSPDSKQIAFVRRVKDKTVLFVYDVETGRQRPVYDDLDRDLQAEFIIQGNYYPKYGWFPDNRHIAIWGKGKLYKVDTETGAAEIIPFRAASHQTYITPPRFVQDLAPEQMTVRAMRQLAVFPDERTVVFHALGRLWRKVLGGGKPVRLTEAQAFEFEPAISPDGRQVAYVDWDDEKGGRLILATAEGRLIRVLAEGRMVFRQPHFSPDGKWLTYKIDAGDKCMGGFNAAPGIYRVAVKGGDSRFVAAEGGSPRYSPDGARIYFIAESYENGQVIRRLQSVTVDGFDRRTHAYAPDADVTDLTISPDLRWIAFKDRQKFYVMPYREIGIPLEVTARAEAVPVTTLSEAGGYALAWTPDSSALHWFYGPQLRTARVADRFAAGRSVDMGLVVPVDKPEGVIAFTNGRIITMEGDRVIEQGTLIVRGNRIGAVGPADGIEIPAGAKVIDITGKTIMPGMVNMHGHIDECYYSSAGLMPEKQASHYASLAFGVTTNYDPYASELASLEVSENNRAGVMVGPRSVSVGRVAFGRERKGDATYLPLDDMEDVRTYMARKAALGVSIIKSYRQPERRQRQQLVKAARDAGIMADVEGESHFYYNLSMILDGHTIMEHNIPLAHYYDDLVQFMAHGETANTPVLNVLFGEMLGENYMYQTTRAWEDPKIQLYVQQTTSGYSPLGTPYAAPPYARAMTTIHVADELWDIGFRAVARSVKKLDDAGVIINAGSHGQIQGLGMHWEIQLLAAGGMSNLHLLRTATLNGAKSLGLDREIGSLEVGKLADLIVMDKNPLDDIRNSNSVRYTMINGRLYDSLSMNEIGNYDRPRSKFYWETDDYKGIDWNETWGHL